MRRVLFKMVARKSLHPFLARDQSFEPTLCVSDTHLTPVENAFSDDAPDDLHAVLEQHPAHRVVILGDMFESLPITRRTILRAPQTHKLAPLLTHLQQRPHLAIVLGNHDVRADLLLNEYFGAHRVFDGGFRVERLRFLHGHERDRPLSVAGRYLGWTLPLVVTGKRLGIDLFLPASSNKHIAHANGTDFVIFGHTHVPELTQTYANTGCFLRHGRQSYITIERQEMKLWARIP